MMSDLDFAREKLRRDAQELINECDKSEEDRQDLSIALRGVVVQQTVTEFSKLIPEVAEKRKQQED